MVIILREYTFIEGTSDNPFLRLESFQLSFHKKGFFILYWYMKKQLLLWILVFGYEISLAQSGVKYDPTIQATRNIQYSKPEGDLFVSDCKLETVSY